MDLPDFEDVRAAHARIRERVHRTPVMTCRTLDAMVGARLFFKCENLQRVGAFKFRGATHAVLCLDQAAAARGVVTHSSGNHAQALALAARERGIPATVVMPEGSPAVKVAAVRGYGARVVFCANTLAAREQACAEVQAASGATLVHAYDDARVIAGQGTAALELLEEVGPLDMVVAPVGGGGLMAGTALAVHGLAPEARVWGAEPALADDAARSLASGALQPPLPPVSVADGLRTALCPRTFAILRQHLEGIGTCPEDSILPAARLLGERMKLVVEPSGAVPLACLLEGTVPGRGLRVGVLLSGGNVDLGGSAT